SILPTGPSIRYFLVWMFMGLARRPSVVHLQPLDHLAVHEVGFNDFVDVGLVHVRVPRAFRVDDDARAFLAAFETARLVDAHASGTCEPELFHALFRVFLHRLRVAVPAARAWRTGLALVQAEEHVVLVEGVHGALGQGARREAQCGAWLSP